MIRAKRLIALVLLGLASGLPFELTGGTFTLWLSDAGLDQRLFDALDHLSFMPSGQTVLSAGQLTTIDFTTMGLFSLVSLPYALKPLWSPFVDRFIPPVFDRFGRRRAWMMVCQIALVLALIAMAAGSPARGPGALAAIALVITFFSATQDIVVDAYRTDVLPASERGLGAALASFGYRGGMLAAGAICPIIGDTAGWDVAYLTMAGLMSLGLFATLFAPTEKVLAPPKTLRAAIVEPWRNLFSTERFGDGSPTVARSTLNFWAKVFSYKHIGALLALVILYKLGDAFGSSLFSAFLRRGLDFSPTEVGAVRKTVGVIAVFVGMFLGGALMLRLSLYRALMGFGILQALTNIVFVVLAANDKSMTSLIVAISAENLATGLGSVAFVAFLTAMCDTRFSATQFALLSSLAALGRVLVGPVAGPTADELGWQGYFWISTFAALPGLYLVWYNRATIDRLGAAGPTDDLSPPG